MNIKQQKLCVWGGPAGVILFFLGFWPLAHFMPPLAPSAGAEEIAAIYRDNAFGIRAGSILMLYAGSVLVPFYAVISVQLQRIEGASAPMAYTQLITGVFAVVPFILSPVLWCAASFRPDRAATEILMLSDLGWIFILMIAPPAMIQFFAIAIGILADRSAEPVFPRWLAYFTFWSAILGIPGAVIVLFHTGPFAWNGIFGFYIPATVFGVWTITMTVMLLKAINRQAVVGA
jgi:hypothetical protein